MASVPTHQLTEEEYLSLEREAETKSEYHDGRMFAMAGATLDDATLANQIGGILVAR